MTTVNKETAVEGILLLIDKPKDYTSARVVNIVKKKLNERKAGHSGTLDPKASGLIVICTGKMTKKLNQLLDADKEYEGVMVLGGRTASFDSETEILETRPIGGVNENDILGTTESFMGEIEQIPPMYSALKYKGKPLYKYARKKQEVERRPRKVTIREFKILSIELPEVRFLVSCSKGTYIRTLVNDFGEKLGTGAYLKDLRRLRVGDYDVKDSMTLTEFMEKGYLSFE